MKVCKKLHHTEPPKGQFSKWEERLDILDRAVTKNYEISEAWPFVVDFINWLNQQSK